MEAQTFLRQLLEWFPLEVLYVGENFHLGRYPGVGARDISRVVKEMGGTLRVDITALANDNDSPISSTRIREAVTKGNLLAVTQLLGRPFRIDLRGVPLLRHGDTWGLLRKWVSQVMPHNGNYAIVLHGRNQQVRTQGSWKSTGAYWEHKNIETLEFLEIQSLIREIPEG
jgi:riboflavin kinase/FMN adenylyltransferase